MIDPGHLKRRALVVHLRGFQRHHPALTGLDALIDLLTVDTSPPNGG